jgi:hypothetical protein
VLSKVTANNNTTGIFVSGGARAASRFPASPSGEKRVSLGVIANHALALRQSSETAGPAVHSWGCREGVRSS